MMAAARLLLLVAGAVQVSATTLQSGLFQFPALGADMLNTPVDPAAAVEMQQVVQNAQRKLDQLIPQEYKDRMRSELDSTMKNVSPTLKEDMKAQKLKIFELLPQNQRTKLNNDPEKFAEQAMQTLQEVSEDVRTNVVNAMQTVAKENMDKEMKANPELVRRSSTAASRSLLRQKEFQIDKLKRKQDEVIDALPPQIKNEVRLTQDEVSRKLQEISIRQQEKNNGVFGL